MIKLPILTKELFLFVLGYSLLIGCKDKTTKPTESMATTEIEAKEAETGKPEIKIIPISHATAVLEWKDVTIYIDPVGGAETFAGQRPPNLILITDVHGDHLSVETLEALDTQKAKIIVPQAVADMIPDNFTPQLDVLHNGDTKERYGIMVEAIPMYNLRKEALKFHEKGRGNGYVLQIEDQRLYFSGDTEDIPEMRALKNIDKAFVCMNLPYTMTPESAASAVLEFKPKQVYPYHYRGRPDVSDVAQFKKLVQSKDNTIQVVQLDWYPEEAY